MRIETLIVLLFSVIMAIVLSWVFAKKDNEKFSLSDDLETRKKVKMPNNYIKYSGEYEKKDTIEYMSMIDKNVIDILRFEDDNNAGK